MTWPTNSNSRMQGVHCGARKLGEIINMENSYKEFKTITDKYYTDWQMPNICFFVELLDRYGIKLRKNDGNLHEATFSVPKSINDALVLGIRYQKKDGTFSEDLFLFRKGKPIQKGYKGELEKIIPEYEETHKGKPNT